MPMQQPTFHRETIFTGTPSERTLCVVGDLNRDGSPEIVLAGRRPTAELYWLGRGTDGSWQRHTMDDTCGALEAGGCLADLTGNSRLDFVAGHDSSGNGLFWWECPEDATHPWPRHEICRMPANQSHDQLVADLDGDGKFTLFFWNQRADTLFCVPVPPDPRVSPWPDIQPVVTGVREEGLAAVDVDGDGRLELVAGQSWYRPPAAPGDEWRRYPYAEGYVSPRVAAADFDGDGLVEIILAEGDASLNGREYGRLVRFVQNGPPTALWRAETLSEQLLDPHSLVVTDLDRDGRPDLFVGELGDPNGNDAHPPSICIYWNRDGGLQEEIIASGLGTHESKPIRLDGRMGIVIKPYRNVRSTAERGPDVDSIHIWLPELAGEGS